MLASVTKSKYIAAALFVFALGIATVYTLGLRSMNEHAAVQFSPDTGGTVDAFRVGQNAIYVPEQAPGSSVTVAFVDIAAGGYVVIHEGEDEDPGAIIGASVFLAPGELEGLTINLSRNTRDGETLFAMLHHDNGDGVFRPADDPPVQDESGNVMYMTFTVSADVPALGTVLL